MDKGITEDHIFSMMHNQTFAILTPTNTSNPYIIVSYVFDTDESTLAKQDNLRPIQYGFDQLKETAQLIVPEPEAMYTWSDEELEDEMEITSAEVVWWDEPHNSLDGPSPWSDTSFSSGTSSDATFAGHDTTIPGPDVADLNASARTAKFGDTSNLLNLCATALSDPYSYACTGAIEPWRTTLVHAVVLNIDQVGGAVEDWSDEYEWMDCLDAEVDSRFDREDETGLSVIEEEDEERGES